MKSTYCFGCGETWPTYVGTEITSCIKCPKPVREADEERIKVRESVLREVCEMIKEKQKKWTDMTLQERSADVLKRAVKAEDIRLAMYHLPWMNIIKRAVESRPTSFGLPNGSKLLDWYGITEWRNGCDEIMMSVIREMEEAGIIPRGLI